MKINDKLVKGYVIGSSVAILALIGGMIYLGMQLHQVNKNVQGVNNTSTPDYSSQLDSISNSISDLTNKVGNLSTPGFTSLTCTGSNSSAGSGSSIGSYTSYTFNGSITLNCRPL